MTRWKDMLLGSLLACALFAPGLAKADPVTIERPRVGDKIEGNGPDLVFMPGLASSRDTLVAPAEQKTVTGWGAASDHAVVMNALADDMQLDLRPDFPGIKVPVTLLYPDNGAPAQMDALSQGAYATVPNKTLIRVDQSKHFIMLHQPAQFDAALDSFLKS